LLSVEIMIAASMLVLLAVAVPLRPGFVCHEWHRRCSEPALQAAARDAPTSPQKKSRKEKALSKDERGRVLRRAQVWVQTDVPTMDLRAGPASKDAFAAGATVPCDYVKTKRSGSSPKFNCRIASGELVKVRYGANNGEVQGSVLASRLLWALGFGADRVYPVRIECRGCSTDPWSQPGSEHETRVFEPAVIERKPEGREIVVGRRSGWDWEELALVDPAVGGAPLEQRDALRLLAVFIQHTDNKAEQQRLLCLPDKDAGVPCAHPFLALHDVGLTFGRATRSNDNDISSVNFVEWAKTPIWRVPEQCIGNLLKSNRGTLRDPVIHEAGRAFLARLLSQLSARQLHDLFDVARVEARTSDPNSDVTAKPAASLDEWVDAFNHKVSEIVAARCPA
jgi:hypothetical protein